MSYLIFPREYLVEYSVCIGLIFLFWSWVQRQCSGSSECSCEGAREGEEVFLLGEVKYYIIDKRLMPGLEPRYPRYPKKNTLTAWYPIILLCRVKFRNSFVLVLKIIVVLNLGYFFTINKKMCDIAKNKISHIQVFFREYADIFPRPSGIWKSSRILKFPSGFHPREILIFPRIFKFPPDIGNISAYSH